MSMSSEVQVCGAWIDTDDDGHTHECRHNTSPDWPSQLHTCDTCGFRWWHSLI